MSVKAIYDYGRTEEDYDTLNFPKGVFKVKEVAPDVYMQEKKHWGMNVYAGERITKLEEEGHSDRSGCLHPETMPWECTRPCVVIYRHYWSKKGKISSVLSYPFGIGAENCYFWEIYCLEGNLFDDIERYFSEEEMERRVIKLLSGELSGEEEK